MLPRHLADPFQGFSTSFCQMKGIQAPVIRVGSAFHEPPLLEIVQDRHQPAGMNFQLSCEFLLAQSGRNAQQPKDSCIWRCEFENPQSFSKLRCGMRSKLGKQERGLSFFHLVESNPKNNYCTFDSFTL